MEIERVETALVILVEEKNDRKALARHLVEQANKFSNLLWETAPEEIWSDMNGSKHAISLSGDGTVTVKIDFHFITHTADRLKATVADIRNRLLDVPRNSLFSVADNEVAFSNSGFLWSARCTLDKTSAAAQLIVATAPTVAETNIEALERAKQELEVECANDVHTRAKEVAQTYVGKRASRWNNSAGNGAPAVSLRTRASRVAPIKKIRVQGKRKPEKERELRATKNRGPPEQLTLIDRVWRWFTMEDSAAEEQSEKLSNYAAAYQDDEGLFIH